MLTKEEIFARRPATLVPVEMPSWGGTVYVREMSANERDSYEATRLEAKNGGNQFSNFRASLVAACACDANGTRLFTAADVDQLGQLPASDIRPLFDDAAKLNGLTDESVEETAKNS